MRRIIFLITFISSLIIGHLVLIHAIPYIYTDIFSNRLLETRISKRNSLFLSPPRDSEADFVPRNNADTITVMSVLDLRDGPLVLDAPLPKSGLYWSVTIFAHDTDVEYILSDRDISPEKHVRVIINRTGNKLEHDPKMRVAEISSDKAILLIRAIMKDSRDKSEQLYLREVLSRTSLSKLPE